MWTLKFKDNSNQYEAVFTGDGIFTTSSVLEEMIDFLLPHTPFVESTPVGPFAVPDLSVGYLAYAFVGPILKNYLQIKPDDWSIEGEGYEWPEDEEPEPGATFSYLDYLRNKREELANSCHAKDTGRFCETTGPAFPSQEVQRPLRPKAPKAYTQESEEWAASLTDEERKAAINYTGSADYVRFNKAATTGTPSAEVDALDSALAKAPKRDEAIRVYRRVGFYSPKPGEVSQLDLFIAKAKVGEEIAIGVPGSFISTSITPRYPVVTGQFSSVIFEINTRSGAAIGNVTQGGGTAKELEVLIPRNTKFRVVSIQKDVQFGPPPKLRGGLGDTMKRTVIQVEEVD